MQYGIRHELSKYCASGVFWHERLSYRISISISWNACRLYLRNPGTIAGRYYETKKKKEKKPATRNTVCIEHSRLTSCQQAYLIYYSIT